MAQLRSPRHALVLHLTAFAVALAALTFPPAAFAGGKKKTTITLPPLDAEHRHNSGAFAFRTPGSWKVEASTENPDAVNLSGDGVMIRFVYHDGENGIDSLHAACMLERLAGAMDQEPAVTYEYDFVGGVVGDRRALDSAFLVTYDEPILGERQWRQRNVTIVGGGMSLCAVTYVPMPLWKKSAPSRALVDAVLGSVTFR
jgi:hypothetical protein